MSGILHPSRGAAYFPGPTPVQIGRSARPASCVKSYQRKRVFVLAVMARLSAMRFPVGGKLR